MISRDRAFQPFEGLVPERVCWFKSSPQHRNPLRGNELQIGDRATIYILPLIAGLDGVWNAQPVSDALSFVITVIFLFREMRSLSKMDKIRLARVAS